MTDQKTDSHQSYGMIGVSHVQSTGTRLVGSEFKHHHYVTISIRRAQRKRDLSREWWFANNEIISVALSEAQFIELMARPNMGDGVPCTIEHVIGERMPDPPEDEPIREKFRKDMQEDARNCVSELREAHAELVAAIESGKIGKTALREIAKKIEYAGCAVSSGIPFVAQQFDKQVEKTIHHAKAEIEATVTQMAMRIGVEEMRLQVQAGAPKLIESGNPL